MSKSYKRVVKQGADLGKPSGMPAIEISGVKGGLRLMQDLGEKQRCVYVDNDSILELIASLEKTLVANGYDRAWQRHYTHAM